MKKVSFLIAMIVLASVTCFAQKASADKILGVWLSEKKDGKIEIYSTGGKYFGKLIWGDKIYQADGKTSRKDENNVDPALRGRNLKDLLILRDFIFTDGVWTNGKIYDPVGGKLYSCTIKLVKDKLLIRGYVGISLFGRSSEWTRV